MKGDKKMETENRELKQGTWDNMQTEYDDVPAIKWEKVGESHTFKVVCAKPREINWESGVFYVFDIEEASEKKVIKTSAWSLLRGMKKIAEQHNNDLTGVEVKITKRMEGGKQFFDVVDLNQPQEEKINEGV